MISKFDKTDSIRITLKQYEKVEFTVLELECYFRPKKDLYKRITEDFK